MHNFGWLLRKAAAAGRGRWRRSHQLELFLLPLFYFFSRAADYTRAGRKMRLKTRPIAHWNQRELLYVLGVIKCVRGAVSSFLPLLLHFICFFLLSFTEQSTFFLCLWIGAIFFCCEPFLSLQLFGECTTERYFTEVCKGAWNETVAQICTQETAGDKSGKFCQTQTWEFISALRWKMSTDFAKLQSCVSF